MVKMMITVVIIYALCWLPLHSITLIGDAHPSIYSYKYIQTVWISCHWLAMSNCCYNPMVYCWMNSRFRTGFTHVFRCLPCVDYDKNKYRIEAQSIFKGNYSVVPNTKERASRNTPPTFQLTSRCLAGSTSPRSSSGLE